MSKLTQNSFDYFTGLLLSINFFLYFTIRRNSRFLLICVWSRLLRISIFKAWVLDWNCFSYFKSYWKGKVKNCSMEHLELWLMTNVLWIKQSWWCKQYNMKNAEWRFVFLLYFSNQNEFDLKRINQKFLLFPKSLFSIS